MSSVRSTQSSVRRLSCAIALCAPLLGCTAVEPVDKSWAEEIRLEAHDFERILGAPFDTVAGRRAWSWKTRLTWDGDFPVSATLRLADIDGVRQSGTDPILRFQLLRPPAPIAVHVVPVEGSIPDAEEVVFVVEHGGEILAAPMANPFRGAIGGMVTPGATTIPGAGWTPKNSCQFSLISVNTAQRINLELKLYLNLQKA